MNHGTRHGYRQGCRCLPCAIAESRYQREWRQGEHRRVDAARLHDHLTRLLASGWDARRLSEEAGLNGNAVWAVMSGYTRRTSGSDAPAKVNSKTADALLAIGPLSDRTPRQHVQDLLRSGWDKPGISEESGVSLSAINKILAGKTKPRQSTVEQLLTVEPLEDLSKVWLPFEPLRRLVEVRMRARDLGVIQFGDTEARFWHRSVASGRIRADRAEQWAFRFGLLLEEVYGIDLDREEAA